MAEIRVDRLHKAFGEFTAVKDSNFTVENGEFFVMLGPSGCGKTTTLRMIAGLELPTSGRILLDGEDVTFLRASQRDIAFVFQLFALYPHMNVRRNIGFPLVCEGRPAAEVRRAVEETARLLRIDHLLDRPVSGLSGGDRQRVALGRAIIRRPKAFLMDEPLGALDAEFREMMVHELRALHDRIGATTVYVTHDQMEAMAMADKIVVMNHGIVEQFGTPQEIYDHPVSTYVADFIGSPPMNLLPVEAELAPGATEVRIGEARVPVPANAASSKLSKFVLGARPEHIRLVDVGGLRSEVLAVEYLGTTQIVTLRTEQGLVRARTSSAIPVHRGENAGLVFTTDRLSLFDAGSGRTLRAAEGARLHG